MWVLGGCQSLVKTLCLGFQKGIWKFWLWLLQGVDGWDVDLPTALEANYITNILAKTLWVFSYIAVYGIRPLLVRPKPVGMIIPLSPNYISSYFSAPLPPFSLLFFPSLFMTNVWMIIHKDVSLGALDPIIEGNCICAQDASWTICSRLLTACTKVICNQISYLCWVSRSEMQHGWLKNWTQDRFPSWIKITVQVWPILWILGLSWLLMWLCFISGVSSPYFICFWEMSLEEACTQWQAIS